MAVFCDVSGVRLVSPTGDEAADYAAWDKSIALAPVSKDVDPRGWANAVPRTAGSAPETKAAPEPERAPQPAATAATDATRKGNK